MSEMIADWPQLLYYRELSNGRIRWWALTRDRDEVVIHAITPYLGTMSDLLLRSSINANGNPFGKVNEYQEDSST